MVCYAINLEVDPHFTAGDERSAPRRGVVWAGWGPGWGQSSTLTLGSSAELCLCRDYAATEFVVRPAVGWHGGRNTVLN